MKIAIYGCGKNAEHLIPTLEQYGINVDICVDSLETKQGTYFMDKYIIQSPKLLQNKQDYYVIVTPIGDSVFKLLINWGYVRGFAKSGHYCSAIDCWAMFLISWFRKIQAEVHFIFAPNINKMVNCSKEELALKNMTSIFSGTERLEWLQSVPPHIKKCYEKFEYFSDEYVKNIFTGSQTIDRDGVLIQMDMKSQYVNVSGGMRVTTNQPEYYDRAIHFFGPSYMYGFGVEDKYTIPSCIQRKLNDIGYTFICFNYGIRGMAFFQYLDKIKSVNIDKNDCTILYLPDDQNLKNILIRSSIPYIDINEYLWEYRADNIFFDAGSHLNYKGNIIVADILYDLIFNRFCYSPYDLKEQVLKNNISKPEYGELNKWIQSVKDNDNVSIKDGKIGAVVMNCNPFTLGHRHLIEIASKIVDYLYVFVVSEDCSEFSFVERFQLVKDGTVDLENIKVIPSGKYMISSVTFPEYFSKEDNQEAVIDMTMDVNIFGKIIAKELNISIRFIGEEPQDFVTKQYNETLKRVLPKYGVKILEIPRIRKNGAVISATNVRQLFHEGKLSELEQYVPKSTFQYLTRLKR